MNQNIEIGWEIGWYDKEMRKFIREGDDPPPIPPERWEESSTDVGIELLLIK